MSRARAALLLSTSLVGCASTSGREWLESPVDARGEPAPVMLTQVDATQDSRPRLRQTVTLGESYSSTAVAAREASAPSPTVVQVNVPVTINNHVGYGYSAYARSGYVRSAAPAPFRSSSTARSGSSQQVGGNWPAIPDYGPKAMR